MDELLEFSAKPFLYVGIFLGMLLLFEGIRQVLSKSESVTETRNRRMKMIAKGASTEDLLNLIKPVQNDWMLSFVPFIGTLPTALRQAGLTIKVQTFMTGILIATLLVTIIASRLVIPAVAFGFAFSLFMLIPIVFVRMAAKKRMSALERQLPEALDLMARGLIVGHPLNTTIASVANEMTDPIASEFGAMSDQIAYGDELVDAFLEFAERTALEDVRYLAISVAIQNGTGGDLGQVLQTLARVIRNRMSMRKRILAISSEGRLTSVFLSLLPVFIFVLTTITSPGYYGDVSDDPLFRPFAAVVVALVVANYLVLRRMVDFRF